MSTFKAEYQKYLDKLKGVDLTSKTSTLTSNVTSCVNNMNNLKSSVSASTWTELGEETFANSVIPSVSTFTSGLSDNIATLEKAASMSKELVDIIEELKTACENYDNLSIEDYSYTDNEGNKQYHNDQYEEKKAALKKAYEDLETKADAKINEIKALTVTDIKVDASKLFAADESSDTSASLSSGGNLKLTQVNGYGGANSANFYMVNTKLSVSEYVKILSSHYNRMTQNTRHPDQCLGYAFKHSGELVTGSWTDKDASNSNSTVRGVSYNNNYYTDKNQLIQKIASEVQAGRPCVLMVNGHKTGTGRHYVTVVGISEKAVKSGHVTEQDLAIIDSWDGHVEVLKNDYLDRTGDHTVRSIYKDNGKNYRYQVYTVKA